MNEDLIKNHSSLFSNPYKMDMECEIVFKFENLLGNTTNHSFGDPETGITQNHNDSETRTNKGQKLENDVCIVPICTQNEKMGIVKSRQETYLERILSPFKKSNLKFEQPRLRRDVVNKTIFRIIRRFFHSLLEKLVHDYKNQKKENLISMLISFSEYLFPHMKSHEEFAHVLSALMFRREILISKENGDNRKNIQVFLDIQSKYTHKHIDEALSNRCFRIIFKYFIDNGLEFFEQDENVQKHSEQYREELQKIVDLYATTD